MKDKAVRIFMLMIFALVISMGLFHGGTAIFYIFLMARDIYGSKGIMAAAGVVLVTVAVLFVFCHLIYRLLFRRRKDK